VVVAQNYESPLDQRLQSPAQIAFSFTVPEIPQTRLATGTVACISPSSSQTSQTGVQEKLAVFKDEEEPATAKHTQFALLDLKTQSRSSSLRDKGEKKQGSLMSPAINRTGTTPATTMQNAPVDLNDSSFDDNGSELAVVLSPAHSLARLQEISDERKKLLHKLGTLQEEEDRILAQLIPSQKGNAFSSKLATEEEDNINHIVVQEELIVGSTGADPQSVERAREDRILVTSERV
jgi:hypothetical protein